MRYTCNILASLTDSWSSSFSRLGETIRYCLESFRQSLAQTFTFWTLLSILSPSLYFHLYSCLSALSVAADVGCHSSRPKSTNSTVPQDSVLSLILILFLINDFLSTVTLLNLHMLITLLCIIPLSLRNSSECGTTLLCVSSFYVRPEHFQNGNGKAPLQPKMITPF